MKYMLCQQNTRILECMDMLFHFSFTSILVVIEQQKNWNIIFMYVIFVVFNQVADGMYIDC